MEDRKNHRHPLSGEPIAFTPAGVTVVLALRGHFILRKIFPGKYLVKLLQE